MRASNNRIKELLANLPDHRFWFHGPQKKLAQAVGISETRLCRIVNSQVEPRYSEVLKLVRFFEQHYQKTIDPREIVSFDEPEDK